MKRICSRGGAFLIAVTLLLGMLSSAAAVGEQEDKTAENQEPLITRVGVYEEGRIRVTDGALWGYAGVGGEVLIQPQFDAVGDFFLGAAQVTKDGKVGLLRWDGVYILKPEYDELIRVNYGVYLGRQEETWDVLSITEVPSEQGMTHQIYSNQVSASIYESTVNSVALKDQKGSVTLIPVNTLPQLLADRRVPGWQFPLEEERKAFFSDVNDDDWYDRWVNLSYSVRLMEGVGEGKFEPLRELTVAETIRLAACLESHALQDDFHLQHVSGPNWYTSSVVYCEAIGVIKPGEYSQEKLLEPITRKEMARIFAATTPVRGIKNINDLTEIKNAIPDVGDDTFASDAIYGLYAKGIINGTDGEHSFNPDSVLTRAEAAAIVSRIARPEQRITFW